MAGRIRADDIALVKERASIEEIVRDQVTLRSAGPGSLKGLCPFHDEKTPSFTVRPSVGMWHCFGCGEGGDVISFVRKADHLSFTEAIERLAARYAIELRYEEGSGPGGDEGYGRRSRLIEAHRVAQEYYAAQLIAGEIIDARAGRDFMRARGFDGAVAKHFGVGFAPRGGDQLVRHLRGKGFSDDDLVTSGLAGRGTRGLYDRFRGRLVWPIRDITGDTVGFGARRLFDDDRIEAKYLNTSETPIYKKSTVLYGLDLAKKAIARERAAVIVEGYTDVMACHLSGVETAVATCGTAFGTDHIKVLRRLMRDEPGLSPARVVFTFDGDAAGQKAAMRAFQDDQRWASQSFAAVEPHGKDPCELRQESGDAAVRGLVEDAVPLFEFAVRTTISRFDLDTAEGRIAALKAVAPIVSTIRDRSLRPEYVRTVAGWLGLDIQQVHDEVARAGRAHRHAGVTREVPPQSAAGPSGGGETDPTDSAADALLEPTDGELADAFPQPNLRDPAVFAERQLLQCVIQFPHLVAADALEALDAATLVAPAHRAVLTGVQQVARDARAKSAQGWIDEITRHTPVGAAALVHELAVAPLPTRMDPASGMPAQRYADELLLGVRMKSVTAKIVDAMSAMRRLDAAGQSGSDEHRALGRRLQDLQREQAALREWLS